MRLYPLLALAAASSLLAGCSGFRATGPAAPTSHSANLQGKVYGGQQPVAGATIQLWQAGATGYGTGAIGLLPNPGVLTDAHGNFNFSSSSYTCTTGSQLYVTATGGNPGGGTNSVLSMVAGLGACETINDSTFVNINEVSTVGTVWALSQFMAPTSTVVAVGAPSTNAAGLAAAFADINTLVNTGTGTSPGAAAPASAFVPTAEIYALANSLAACINSTGTGGNGSCDSLFSYTTPSGGSAPTNVAAAALNITRNPAVHANDILALASPASPFASTFQTANDLTLSVTYKGSGLAAPSAVALDASGDVWVTNASANTVTELTRAGVPLSGFTGYSAGPLSTPSAIAIDTTGNAWIANSGNSTLTELSSTGTLNGTYTGGGLATPSSVAIDAFGTIWLANAGNSTVSAFNASGTALSPTGGFAASGASGPVGIAINPR